MRVAASYSHIIQENAITKNDSETPCFPGIGKEESAKLTNTYNEMNVVKSFKVMAKFKNLLII